MSNLLPSVLLVFALASQPVAETTRAKYYESPLVVSEATPLQLYLEKLAWYESQGREDINIIDTNGLHSKGCLQFQDATWQEQTRKYGIQGNIMNCADQKKVAEQMFLHDPNAPRHWSTSIFKRGLGLPPVRPVQSAR